MRVLVLVRVFVLMRMLMFVRMRQIAVRMLVRMALMRVLMSRLRMRVRQVVALQDVDLGACNPAAVHPFDPQACPQAQRGGRVLQHLFGNPGIDQRSQQHVARDPGKTVNVRNAHKISLLELYRVCVRRPYRAGPIAETGSTAFIEPDR